MEMSKDQDERVYKDLLSDKKVLITRAPREIAID